MMTTTSRGFARAGSAALGAAVGWALLGLATLGAARAQDDGTRELLELAKSPQEISPPRSTARAGFKIPAGKGVLIETPECIAFLELHGESPTRQAYHFRTFHKASGSEIRGEGEVYERYYHLSKANEARTIVVDRGSLLTIDAGFVKLRWSAPRWIYLDPKTTQATPATLSDYRAKTGREAAPAQPGRE